MSTNRTVKPKLTRDSNGRFTSISTAKSSTPVKAKSTKTVSKAKASKPRSSFIQRMNIVNGLVEVVMARNPNTTYTYKIGNKALKQVTDVITNGGSLGEAYNKLVIGNEISRTIYRA